MHVYRMQKMLEAQGKDRVVNVRSRASLYQTIERLERHGLVEVYETRRVEGYPDRVVYAITDAGREVARQWLREMLHNTERTLPRVHRGPVDPVRSRARGSARRARDAREQATRGAGRERARAGECRHTGLPRLFLLEEEYRKAMLEAEIAWVRGVIEDLRKGG